MTPAILSPMSLTEFLLARVAEDEAVARRVIADRRRLIGQGSHLRDPDVDPALYADEDGKVPQVGTSAERILAECAAKRAIVERAGGSVAHAGQDIERQWTLRALASVYADHADFDTAWIA